MQAYDDGRRLAAMRREQMFKMLEERLEARARERAETETKTKQGKT